MDSCNTQPGMLDLSIALEKIQAQLEPTTKTVTLPIKEALNSILAEDILAPINVPDYPCSAMDGYAYAHDSIDFSRPIPVAFTVLAGNSSDQSVPAGQCIRIMTGAPLPQGADTVIMQEDTQKEEGAIRVEKAPKKGANAREAGDNIKKGQCVAKSGEVVSPSHVGLFASLGMSDISVFAPLTVGVFSSGDELIIAGETLEFGQIYDSNRQALTALLAKLPVTVKDYGIIPDDLPKLRQAFLQADKECDLVITSGGVSVGEADFTKVVLDELGKINFWKIAMKPGKPVAFGHLPNSVFFGLPGNPVSAVVTFVQVVVPALVQMSGGIPKAPLRFSATMLDSLKKKPGRMDFQRGVASVNENGQWVVSTCRSQGSGVFSAMTQSNCFMVLERERGSVEAGETVTIEMFTTPLI